MRPLREYIDIVTEKVNTAELERIKQVIAAKIKQLPDDDVTKKALAEIEDLLRNVNAGGKAGIINGRLQAIDDPTVRAAQKELARYILSIDMTPAQRDELFDLWKADQLVNHAALLKKGQKTIADVIPKYNSNPAIKEFVDDIMSIAALGQGKGEFGLSVLSRQINKPEKGDLVIKGIPIEVKTTDGGAGRFTDQEVRPGEGFEMAARNLNAFFKTKGINLPKSGVSMTQAVQMVQNLAPKERANYLKLVREVIARIFSGMDVEPIINSIESGNLNNALKEYSEASFNYYMSKKNDEGVLYISLAHTPTLMVMFKDARDLAATGMRFHSKTIYITSINDVRLPYPQMEIVPTKAGVEFTGPKGGVDIPASEPAAPIAAPSTVTGKRTSIRPPGTEEPTTRRNISPPRKRR